MQAINQMKAKSIFKVLLRRNTFLERKFSLVAFQLLMISLIKGANCNIWIPQIIPHPSVSCRFKRFLDILGSMVGFVVLAIVFLPIAIAIKIDSPPLAQFCLHRKGTDFTDVHLAFVNFVQWFRMPKF